MLPSSCIICFNQKYCEDMSPRKAAQKRPSENELWARDGGVKNLAIPLTERRKRLSMLCLENTVLTASVARSGLSETTDI